MAKYLREDEIIYALYGILSSKALVRKTTLELIDNITILKSDAYEMDEEIATLLLLGKCDVDDDNAEIGEDVWEMTRCHISNGFINVLFKYLCHKEEDVRDAAAAGLEEGLNLYKEATFDLLNCINHVINSNYSTHSILLLKLNNA